MSRSDSRTVGSEGRRLSGYNTLLAMPEKLGEPLVDVLSHGTLRPKFSALHTSPISICMIVLSGAYIFAAIFAFHWAKPANEFEYNAVTHAMFFFIVEVVDRLVFGMHKKYQALGYLRLYRKTNFLRQMPYLIIAQGNAGILILWATVAVKDISYDVRNLLLKILVCTEMVVIIGCSTMYTFIVLRHNASKELPDAQKSLDHSMMTPLADDSTWDSSGSWMNGAESSIVSRQADMIKFLQEQQQNLSREILLLHDKLKHAEQHQRSGDVTRQADEGTVLAQVEQERRYLQVERDGLEETVRVMREDYKSNQAMVAQLRKTVREQAEEIAQLQGRTRAGSAGL